MSITYYAMKFIGDKEPRTVSRFFDDLKRCPEVYRPGEGWVASRSLWPRVLDGDLTKDDVISEEEAMRVIQRIDSRDAAC